MHLKKLYLFGWNRLPLLLLPPWGARVVLMLVGLIALVGAISTVSLVNLSANLSRTQSSLSSSQSRVEAESCQLQYFAVQLALNAYMADNHLTVVPALDQPSDDMSTPVPLYVENPSIHHSYLQFRHTDWAFTWDSSGRVHSISGRSVAAGCYVGDPFQLARGDLPGESVR